MGAKTKTLITLEEVTDHDCGNYTVGEIDWGINIGSLDEYIVRYGYKGKQELIYKMACLMNEVAKRFEERMAARDQAQTSGT